jgi:indole-3-glycerol phosphate synthase
LEENLLTPIVQARKTKLEQLKKTHPIVQSLDSPELHPGRVKTRSFLDALDRNDPINIIAEIKKASPSKGILCDDFDPVQIAMDYESNGAAAISVLTEEDYFMGSLDHLKQVRHAVVRPILRKDFIFDSYQLYEAAKAGADAVLLIVAILDPPLLSNLIELAEQLGMDALVEVHDLSELRIALECNAQIIGVNNRDLKTFRVDINTSVHLAPHVPDSILLVSESGIQTADDIRILRNAGYDGYLIGEFFMQSINPGKALRELIIRSHN